MSTVIDTLKKSTFSSQKRQLESDFLAQINQLSKLDCVSEIRCHGLLAAIQTNKLELDWRSFWKCGAYVFVKQGMLILAPPFILNTTQLEELMEVIEEVLAT